MDQPILLAAVADLHTNSFTGLCPPVVTLDNAGTYRANKAQRIVWRAWCEFWDTVGAKAQELGTQVYAVLNGDLNDANVYDKTSLITRAEADIVKMSVAVLEPALEVADKIFIVRGTEAHVGKRASLEEEVAKDIGAVKDEVAGTYSWYWLPLSANGVLFDIAHHPQTVARRPWTWDAAANRSAYIIRSQYLDRGEKPPDVALRAHVHKYGLSNGRLPPHFFYLPPWQLTTNYGHRLGAGSGIEPPGGLVFVCQDGQFTWKAERWLPRKLGLRRKPWRET